PSNSPRDMHKGSSVLKPASVSIFSGAICPGLDSSGWANRHCRIEHIAARSLELQILDPPDRGTRGGGRASLAGNAQAVPADSQSRIEVGRRKTKLRGG